MVGLVELGVTIGLQGRHDEAAAKLRLANSLVPNNPDIVANLATALRLGGREMDARVLLEKSLRLTRSERLALELVDIYVDSRLDAAGESKLLESLKYINTEDSSPRDLTSAARGYAKTGQVNRAKWALRCTLEFDPCQEARLAEDEWLGELM